MTQSVGTITLSGVTIGSRALDTLFLTRHGHRWGVVIYCHNSRTGDVVARLKQHSTSRLKTTVIQEGFWRGWTEVSCNVAASSLDTLSNLTHMDNPEFTERTFRYSDLAQTPPVVLALKTFTHLPMQLGVRVERLGRMVLGPNDRLTRDIAGLKTAGKTIFAKPFFEESWCYFRSDTDLSHDLHKRILESFALYSSSYNTSR